MNERLEHLVSADDLSREMIESIFTRAQVNKRYHIKPIDLTLSGKIIISLFYEPSTRTRLSFESAALRLGGQVIGTENAKEFSSVAKGETLEDTIRVIGRYGHLIVLRHDKKGSATKAAAVSSVPIINAGDGTGEHPSQTLLDLFTIQGKLGRIDGLTIGMAGDLLNGRTIRSLVKALSRCYRDVKIAFISPTQLTIPTDISQLLDDRQIAYLEYKSLYEVPMQDLDCLYMTRVQKERFEDKRDYEAVKDCCILRADIVARMKHDAIIMHPLPRVNEIPQEMDDDPRAVYFDQAENGLYVRMALLEMMLA